MGALLTVRVVRLLVAAALAFGLAGAGFLVILVGGLSMQQTTQQAMGRCGSDSLEVVPVAADSGSDPTALAADQLANAQTILSVAQAKQVPSYGWVVGLATALQESGLRNLDHGHLDSLGLFQQRPSMGWGTPEQILDPEYAAGQFFDRLLAVPGWQEMTVTAAAQAVQRSGFPDAYAQHEDTARALVAELAPHVEVATLTQTSTCAAGAGIDTDVVMPLPAGTYTNADNYGQTSSHWATFHTGVDFAAPCGTPVLAATAGTVIVETGSSVAWSGTWLVKVQTAPGALTTWYGHLQRLTVTHGQTVAAGDQIGEVGALGNATGCHLHFEVHPRGGGYQQDQVDPIQWLAEHVGKRLKAGAAAQPVAAIGSTGTATSFRLATFNVLGNSHTGPGGDQHPTWRAGPKRIVDAIALLDARAVTVAGLQEFEPVQHRAFQKAYSGRWASWFPGEDTRNAVIWRADTWQLLGASSFGIPYIKNIVQMPIVLLQHRTTGTQVYVVNVHNPSDMYGDLGAARAKALQIESTVVDKLLTTGTPMLLTGDFNDVSGPVCTLTPRLMHAFGPSPRGCEPPPGAGIDHIFGGNATFADTVADTAPAKQEISDHPLAMTTVSVEG